MYESFPNSRRNSQNRSSVIRSKNEFISKSPLLQQVTPKSYADVQTFKERPTLIQADTFKNTMFEDEVVPASNKSLAPYMQNYLENKILVNKEPEEERQ